MKSTEQSLLVLPQGALVVTVLPLVVCFFQRSGVAGGAKFANLTSSTGTHTVAGTSDAGQDKTVSFPALETCCADFAAFTEKPPLKD